jgi:tetratricopeptide (TPR) repeat protein
MMPESKRNLAALRSCTVLVLVAGLVACASAPGDPAVKTPVVTATNGPRGESESLMAAETALRDGNCRVAAENFLAAAQVSTNVGVAAKAAQLAVGCEQFDVARAAAARWRKLEPYSGDAALTAALVALKRYDLVEAREALTAWRDSGSAGSQDPLRFAELLENETTATAVYPVFSQVLVGDEPTAAVLLAQARLALSAQNMRAAMQAAQKALALDADLIEAQVIVLRALSVLGEHNAAVEGARALSSQLQGEDAFLLADLLTAADRSGEAEQELTRLAAVEGQRAGAERRRILKAFEDGDYTAVEQRLGTLMGDRGTTALAILLSAQLAERLGDDVRAIQAYRLLADSSLALTARTNAARLMLKRGDQKSALALLDEYAAQHIESTIEVGAARAQLLAQSGDAAAALTGLEALDAQYPGHPDLAYQRATVLETAGRTREAVAQFELAMKARPEDPQLSNALGFTLADHNTRLPRAEQLVRQAIAISPDNPAIQDSLGWVMYRRGKPKEALSILETAWRNSRDGEIAAHYGELLWKTGDEGKARYIWQQALVASPGHKGLQSTMQRLTGEAPATGR